MDLNELLKGLIAQYGPKVQQGLGLAKGAAQHGLGLMGEDAATAAQYMSDPRMAGIGLGPEGAVAGKGLGLLAGVLRGVGGSREALNPLLMQAWLRGDELVKLQDAIRKAPNAYGFETTGAWRKSLSEEDRWALFLRDQTGDKLTKSALKESAMLERDTPLTAEEQSYLETRRQYPPGESEASYALGLNRAKLARQRREEAQGN